MLKKSLLCLLLACMLAGCSLEAGNQNTPSNPGQNDPLATAQNEPTLNAESTPTALPSATPIPLLTATPLPSPVSTRGPEAWYKRLVVIDQDTQTMYVYENGVKIRTIPVSTGNPNDKTTMTPAWEGTVGKYVGTFYAFGAWADDAWYLFEHYGAMLIHGAPYLKEGDKKVYQELDALGVRPVSHGCIRLPPEEAKWFTSWKPQGAHVIIKPLTRSP